MKRLIFLSAFFITLSLFSNSIFALTCPPSNTNVQLQGANNQGIPSNFVLYDYITWALTLQNDEGTNLPIDGGGLILGDFIKAEWYAMKPTTTLICYYTYPSGRMILTSQGLNSIPPYHNGVPDFPWEHSNGDLYTCTQGADSCSLLYVN